VANNRSTFISQPPVNSNTLRRFWPLSANQRGQAMPLGIALVLVGFVGAFVLFNTGQVAVNKQRLSDAADSAAYSGMLWQARALNFQAYTNRAMIANDVTVGQAVSLTSWTTYSVIATQNIADVTSVVPILNSITQTIARVMDGVNRVVVPVADVMVTALEVINEAIGFSQESMFASAYLATPDIVDKVAKASDDNFETTSGYAVAGIVNNLGSWQGFTEKYDRNNNVDAMRERTDMISQSRDDFATDRDWKFFKKNWFFLSPFTHYRLYYTGQTRLLMSQTGTPEWEWVGKDALSLHVKTYSFGWRGRKKRINQLPIGWASAYANSQSANTLTIDGNNSRCRNYITLASDGPDASCKFLASNETAEDWANRGVPSPIGGNQSGPIKLTGYRGVQAFRSLSQEILEDEDGSGDPVLRLRTEISMDMQNTETSNDWVHDSEPFATELASAGNKLSSISIAEVYYRHPKAYRTSKNTISMQKANGYNPYWDVRLAPVDIEERLVALALREGVIDGGGGSTTPGADQLASYGGGDDVTDVDIGGNVTDLPEYVGTLASAMELDETLSGAMESKALDVLASRTGITVDDIAGFEQLADIDAIQNSIENALKEALEEAKDELLASLSGSLSIGGVNVQDAIDHGEAITNEALAINERMEAVRDQVAADFKASLLAEVGPYEELVASIREQIVPVRDDLSAINAQIAQRENSTDGPSDYLLNERDRLEGEIGRLNGLITTAATNLTNTITTTVIDSMARHGAEFFADGITGELRDYFARDLQPMIGEYLLLTPEERAAHQASTVLPWDDPEEEEQEEQPDNYSENNYGNFED